MLSAWEWGQLANFTSSQQRIALSMLCGLLLILMIIGVLNLSHVVNFLLMGGLLWLAFAWWIIALLLVLCYKHSTVFWSHSQLLRLIFGFMTIVPFFWGTLALRHYGYQDNHFTGAWYVLYVMLLAWSMDSGAYIFGKLFGKHKLLPKISPGKTWEGLGGGLITAAFTALLFNKYAPLNIVPVTLLSCSIIAVFAAIIGDLVESMFKREAGIKNSGYLLPGHGGILDCIDSLTASVPIFACLMLLAF